MPFTRIHYEEGQMIRGFRFLYETEPRLKNKYRSGMFICPHCNEQFETTIDAVKRKIVSCGCIQRKQQHGYKGTSLYNRWVMIKQRCLNPNNKGYPSYGGRGITIYKEWVHDPKSFIEYCMTLDGWNNKKLSIDRIDNDGNYEPGNLRFSSSITQSRNTRRRKSKFGYTGVKEINGSKYSSCICVNYKRINLGVYDTPLEAAKGRDKYIIDNKLDTFKLQTK